MRLQFHSLGKTTGGGVSWIRWPIMFILHFDVDTFLILIRYVDTQCLVALIHWGLKNDAILILLFCFYLLAGIIL